MDLDKLKDFLSNNDHFIKDIGIEIETISEGYAKCRLEHNERHRNANGFVNGGALYTLADFTGVCAASSYGYRITTVTGSVNYLTAVSVTDHIICTGQVKKFGKRIINIDVRITDENGKIFMQSDLTFFNLGKKLELG